MKEAKMRQTTVGFSPTPTLYRLWWQGGPREDKFEYVRCGADLLLSGLSGDLEAEARCPVCGNLTKLLIVERKIASLEPKDAVLHVLETPAESRRVWIECEATHIFDRQACMQKWTSTYKGRHGLVASIENYYDMILRRCTDPRKIVPVTRIGPSDGLAAS